MTIVTLDYASAIIQDTELRKSSPSSNYGSGSTHTINLYDNTVLMKFSLGLIPNNAIIQSATLKFVKLDSNALIINVHKVLEPWDELQTTYNTRPMHSDTIETSVDASNSYTLDITNLVQEWVNGVDNHGLLLASPNGNTAIYTQNYSTASFRPTLTIDYSIPTDDKKQVEFVGGLEYTTNDTGFSEHTLNVPQERKQGDVLVAYISSPKGGGIPTYPNDWNIFQDDSNTDIITNVLYKISDGTEQNISIGLSSIQTITAYIAVYRNVKEIIQGKTSDYHTSNYKKLTGGSGEIPKNSLFTLFSTVNGNASRFDSPLNFKRRVFAKSATKYPINVSDTYNYEKTSYSESETIFSLNSGFYGKVTSVIFTPITNEVPHIDGQDEHIGNFDTAFTKEYTVTDTEGDNVTITEKLNGEVIATKTGEGTHTLDLSSLWDSLPLGKHTITIEANDDYDNPPHDPRVRTWTFTKLLHEKAKVPQVVSGISDVVTKFEGLKQLLVDKVGGDVSSTFENIIKEYKAIMKASGVAVSDSGRKIEINGLTFQPQLVITWKDNVEPEISLLMTDIHATNTFVGKYKTTASGQAASTYTASSYARVQPSNGFTTIVYTANEQYNWIALAF